MAKQSDGSTQSDNPGPAIDWPEVRRRVAAGETVTHHGDVLRTVQDVDALAAEHESPQAKRDRRDALRRQLEALDAEVEAAPATPARKGSPADGKGDAGKGKGVQTPTPTPTVTPTPTPSTPAGKK